MRILIIGSRGQLGSDLIKCLTNHDLLTPSHSELEVTRFDDVNAYLHEERPDVVVNTSAFHDVPTCERQPETAFMVNAIGPKHLASVCKSIDARFFHISTDYVFDGEKGIPYEETDRTAPLMVYGASKVAGEHLVFAENDQARVVRTTGLFGHNPCRAKPGGRNFIELMLFLGKKGDTVKVVHDQLCCPTYTPDLARQIQLMVEHDCTPGIYHAVTPEGTSWYVFAKMIFETAGMDVALKPVSSDFFPSDFRRPSDSRLAPSALKNAGLLVMRPLPEVLVDYFDFVDHTSHSSTQKEEAVR